MADTLQTTLLELNLQRDAHGCLVLTLPDGTRHAGVVPVRAFPIAAPDEGLSLMGGDGKEALWIDRLDQLAPAARALVEQELAAREFVPKIVKIRSVSSYSTPSTWQVDTDRGPTQLVLKGEEDIRKLQGRTRLRITGSDALQFSIPDTGALDRASQRLLERFL
jgi:hypothetical protein